jgi:hypothetical protein
MAPDPRDKAGEPGAFAVCWSGGSGIAYGLRLVEVLLESGCEVHLCATGAALRVLVHEGGCDIDLERPALASLFPEPLRGRLRVHALDAVEAAPSSGSAGIRATIIAPCRYQHGLAVQPHLWRLLRLNGDQCHATRHARIDRKSGQLKTQQHQQRQGQCAHHSIRSTREINRPCDKRVLMDCPVCTSVL